MSSRAGEGCEPGYRARLLENALLRLTKSLEKQVICRRHELARALDCRSAPAVQLIKYYWPASVHGAPNTRALAFSSRPRRKVIGTLMSLFLWGARVVASLEQNNPAQAASDASVRRSKPRQSRPGWARRGRLRAQSGAVVELLSEEPTKGRRVDGTSLRVLQQVLHPIAPVARTRWGRAPHPPGNPSRALRDLRHGNSSQKRARNSGLRSASAAARNKAVVWCGTPGKVMLQ
jgi:hypothetical protein